MEVNPKTRTVRLGPRKDTGQWVVQLRFEILDEQAQVLECVEMSILSPKGRKPRPLDANSVRRLNTASLIHEAREALLAAGAGEAMLDAERLRQTAERGLSRSRRSRLGSDHWVRVAEVYTEARRAGDPPTIAVMEDFGVSYSRAAKYVGRARELGLLTKAGKGRASGTIHYAEARLTLARQSGQPRGSAEAEVTKAKKERSPRPRMGEDDDDTQ